MTSTQYAPVFQQGENRLILLHPDFVAETEQSAWEISVGASLVECVLLGITPSRVDGVGEVVAIVDSQIPHFPAKLGPYRVALLSGPLFDEYTAPVADGAAT